MITPLADRARIRDFALSTPVFFPERPMDLIRRSFGEGPYSAVLTVDAAQLSPLWAAKVKGFRYAFHLSITRLGRGGRAVSPTLGEAEQMALILKRTIEEVSGRGLTGGWEWESFWSKDGVALHGLWALTDDQLRTAVLAVEARRAERQR